MKVTDLDFVLPESLIALRPSFPRDSSRLLVLHGNGSVEHRRFSDLPEYLEEGDLLLLNNTKVFPAMLPGTKKTGGKIEMLLVREIEADTWEILCRERYTGTISISDGLSGEMSLGKTLTLRSGPSAHIMDILWKTGEMPLPPYIKRRPDEKDKESYQTVYADKVGSIAAPTAGLHFTARLLSRLEEKGVLIGYLTLHVGTGTFRPVRVEDPEDHVMEAEHFEIGEKLIGTIAEVKSSGKRVISVGTTTTRAIEGFFSGRYEEGDGGTRRQKKICGSTDMFIYPGYRFKVVDSLITNFHLPRSTPLMLTSALCGGKNLMAAYASAISTGYRFFSYGDAMLLL